MIGIYKITNKINGKVYIGQSVNIKQRWRNHRTDAFAKKSHKYNSPLYRSMRKYGIENFLFEIIQECSKEDLNRLEIFYIAKYHAHGEKGYNQTDGGYDSTPSRKLNNDEVDRIIHMLKTTLVTSFEISRQFNVSRSTIDNINHGACYHRENETYPIRQPVYELELSENGYRPKQEKIHKCPICGTVVSEDGNLCKDCWNKKLRKVDRPSPLELARLIKEFGFENVGRQFNVSGNTIKKWCRGYEIPYKLKEVIDWYNLQMGIKENKTKKEKIDVRKPVKQIDPQTRNVVNVFESSCAAGRAFGKTNGNRIGEVCRGLRPMAYGYYWEFV